MISLESLASYVAWGIGTVMAVIATVVLIYRRRRYNYRKVNLATWFQILILLAAVTVVSQEWGKDAVAPGEVIGIAAALCFVLRGRFAYACVLGFIVGLGALNRMGVSDFDGIPMAVAVLAGILLIYEKSEELFNKEGNDQAQSCRNSCEQCNVKADR